MALLQKGDIIRLEAGMGVYTEIPQKFVYANRHFSDELCNHDIEIEEVLTNSNAITNSEKVFAEIVREIISTFETEAGLKVDSQAVTQFVGTVFPRKIKLETFKVPAGLYVVKKTACEGETLPGSRDPYPNGHHVFCYKQDTPSLKVDFYQTGCFTAMIYERDISPVGKI
jgi:hypothetical protein